MSYRRDVAIATDKEGRDKILKVAKDFKPEVKKVDDDTYILYWLNVRWDISDEAPIYNAIQELGYYDYSVLGEDGCYEEYHGKDGPYILGNTLSYFNKGKWRGLQ